MFRVLTANLRDAASLPARLHSGAARKSVRGGKGKSTTDQRDWRGGGMGGKVAVCDSQTCQAGLKPLPMTLKSSTQRQCPSRTPCCFLWASRGGPGSVLPPRSRQSQPAWTGVFAWVPMGPINASGRPLQAARRVPAQYGKVILAYCTAYCTVILAYCQVERPFEANSALRLPLKGALKERKKGKGQWHLKI